MIIEILGARGEIKPTKPFYRNHSGILINNELMLDLGESEYLKYKPKWILITHLHPDHAFFMRKNEQIKVKNIYGPEKSANAKIEVKNRKFKIGKYTITPIPTHHSKFYKSQAYKIESEGKSVLYTGDMIWINKEYHYLLEGLNLIITEASFFKEGGVIQMDKESGKLFGHNGIPDIIRLFKQFGQTILLVHFGRWFVDDVKNGKKQIEKLAKKEKIKIIVGHEKMKLEI